MRLWVGQLTSIRIHDGHLCNELLTSPSWSYGRRHDMTDVVEAEKYQVKPHLFG